MKTSDKILEMTQRLFARKGYDGFNMRLLAERLHIAPSVIYHHYKDKDELLKQMYLATNTQLGKKRELLPLGGPLSDMLHQRIRFQFDHMQEIVAVLKYYLHFRSQFLRRESGRLPNKAILHIEEILTEAVEQGEYKKFDIQNQAKIITHIINGYLLEIFPTQLQPKELHTLTEDLKEFILRGLEIYRAQKATT